MRTYRWLSWAAPVLALVLIACTPEISHAQRRGGGRYEGGGRYNGGGRYYGGDYNRGWGGPYIGIGFGYPVGGYYGGYSDYGAPTYSYSSPGYVESAPNSMVYGSAMTSAPSTTQSFYAGPPPANMAAITINLPANGSVSFGSFQATQNAGATQYETPKLADNDTYGYDVQAKWTENGKEVSRTKHVTFRAGQQVTVDFNNP